MKALNLLSAFCILSIPLSAQPNIQWQRSLGGNSVEEAACVQQTTDGGYIMATYASSMNGDVSGNHGGSDFWIVKMTNTGPGTPSPAYFEQRRDKHCSNSQRPLLLGERLL